MDKYQFTEKIIDSLLTKTKNARLNQKDDDLAGTAVGYSHKGLYRERYILVAFPSVSSVFPSVLDELIKIRRYDIGFDVAFSPDIKDVDSIKAIKAALRPRHCFDGEDVSLDTIIEGVQGFIVPTMSQNDIIKLSLGIQDSFVLALLWSALWQGFPVLIDIKSMLNKTDSECRNQFLRQMMNSYIDKLKLMGVTSITGKKYLMTVLDVLKLNDKGSNEEGTNLKEVSTNGLITEKDMLKIASGQKTLSISGQTIITPLALDAAKRIGVTLVKEVDN